MSKEELLKKLAKLIEQEWKDASVEVITEDDEPAVAIEFGGVLIQCGCRRGAPEGGVLG
jgi:hypothetical protein